MLKFNYSPGFALGVNSCGTYIGPVRRHDDFSAPLFKLHFPIDVPVGFRLVPRIALATADVRPMIGIHIAATCNYRLLTAGTDCPCVFCGQHAAVVCVNCIQHGIIRKVDSIMLLILIHKVRVVGTTLTRHRPRTGRIRCR